MLFKFIFSPFLFSPSEDNLKILTAEGCVQDICNVLEVHGDSKDCVDAALSALSALSTESRWNYNRQWCSYNLIDLGCWV